MNELSQRALVLKTFAGHLKIVLDKLRLVLIDSVNLDEVFDPCLIFQSGVLMDSDWIQVDPFGRSDPLKI